MLTNHFEFLFKILFRLWKYFSKFFSKNYWQITDRPLWKNFLHLIGVAVFAIRFCFLHPALVPVFITDFILSNVSVGIFHNGTPFESSSRRKFSAMVNLLQIVIFGVFATTVVVAKKAIAIVNFILDCFKISWWYRRSNDTFHFFNSDFICFQWLSSSLITCGALYIFRWELPPKVPLRRKFCQISKVLET